MAKILLIISALVIAATAYLGFATKQKVDAIQGDLTEKKKATAQALTDLGKATKSQKKAEDELGGAKAEVEAKDKELTAKKGEVDTINAALAKTKEELAAAQELAKNQTPGAAPTPAADVEQMQRDLQAAKDAKSKAENDLAEVKQNQDTLTRQLMEEKSKTTAAQTQVRSYKEDFTRPGVTGTILAYNPGWNFVVLSIGDKQSLKAGKEMVVTRDGQMVGKVRVKTVEPTTSIADVIPSSVPKGQSVQPGDRVVYEGQPK